MLLKHFAETLYPEPSGSHAFNGTMSTALVSLPPTPPLLACGGGALNWRTRPGRRKGGDVEGSCMSVMRACPTPPSSKIRKITHEVYTPHKTHQKLPGNAKRPEGKGVHGAPGRIDLHKTLRFSWRLPGDRARGRRGAYPSQSDSSCLSPVLLSLYSYGVYQPPL